LCGTLDDFFDLQRFKLFPAWCLLLKKKELIANFICRFFIWFKTRTQRKATSTILNHHSSIKKNLHYAMRLTTQIAHHFREIHFGKNWWATTAQGGHGTGRPRHRAATRVAPTHQPLGMVCVRGVAVRFYFANIITFG